MHNKSDFSGDLSFMGLADTLQMLNSSRRTGILQIAGNHTSNKGLVYFHEGSPIDAACDHLSGIDALYSMFGWSEGNIEFREEPVNRKRAITMSLMEICIEAMRKLDEGEISRTGPMNLAGPSKGDGDDSSAKTCNGIPLITGPPIDYSYVLEENLYNDGDKIIRQGGHGGWIWVVLDGYVDIIRESSSDPVTLVRLGQGAFIGTFTSLEFSGCSRNANVKAVGDVCVGLLDTLRLSGEYSLLSSDFKRLVQSMTGRLEKVTDRAVDKYLNNEEDRLLRNNKLIKKNEFVPKGLFSITRGEINLMGKITKGYMPLMRLAEEDVFGKVPFMDIGHEPQNAMVVASEKLEVRQLETDSLQEEYDRLSGIMKGLVDNVRSCVSVTTDLVFNG